MAIRRIGWALVVTVGVACGGSAPNASRVSGTSASPQACTTSAPPPAPLSALAYDARPNPPVNLLQNGDVEAGSGTTPASWRVDANPAGATLTWDTGRALSGTRALLVTTTAAGRAAWAQDVAAVEAGLRYRLRANVFATVAGAGTHALEITWLDGSGATVGHDVLQSSAAGAWAEVDGFVTAPSASAKATVAVAALAPGQYSFDDVILVPAEPEPIPVAGGFPLGFWLGPSPGVLKNSNFTVQGAPGAPLSWQRSLARGDATLSWNSSGSLDIAMSAPGDASWFQNVPIDPAITYQLRARVLAASADPASHDVDVVWQSAGGATLGTAAVSSPSAGAWADVATGPLKPPAGAVSARVSFRVLRPGTYHAQKIQLVAAAGSGPIFDPRSVLRFSNDPNLQMEHAVEFDAVNAPGAVVAAARRGDTAVWLGGDEIAWSPQAVTPSAAVAQYTALRALGPPAASLPVWINHAPRGPWAQPSNYALLQPYSLAADVISMDVYPVPAVGHAQLPNEGPWSVGQYTDIVRDSIVSWGGLQRKVVWMVLEGFDWWEIADHDTGDHGVAVVWLDGGGTVLRTDTVGADQTNAWRVVQMDGLVPPAGAATAVLKVGAYNPGTYSFSDVAMAEQGGGAVIASTSEMPFPEGSPRGEREIGRVTIRAGARYTVTARVLAQTRPTIDQSRFMAWDAVIHGARGLTWWGFHYMAEGDPLLAEIAQVASELDSVSADLMAPRSLRDVHASDASVEGTLFASPGGPLLVVANRTNSAVTATVSVGGTAFTAVSSIQGDCVSSLSGGNAFQDDFAPLAVHVYRLR